MHAINGRPHFLGTTDMEYRMFCFFCWCQHGISTFPIRGCSRNRRAHRATFRVSVTMVAFPGSSKESTPNQLPVISIISLPFDQQTPDEGAKTPATDSLSSGTSLSSITTVTGTSTENLDEKCIRKQESTLSTLVQVAVPFFIAGLGTIGAGVVLEKVQYWTVFNEVAGILVLVPALLGLKGNLDMCLASRMCTQANLGNISSSREMLKMVVGNISLVQVQAIVAAILVSLFSILLGYIVSGSFVFNHALLLMASSVFTATTSCFILDFVMIAVVLLAYKCNCNPDNLATPLAASVGDVVSVSCLATISSVLYKNLDEHTWILYLIMAIYGILLPFWICIVRKNTYTRHILTSGWIPVLSALFISGLGGLVLDQAVDSYKGFVIFQPIINGIGGNLVSVQSSRISTMFHQTSILGIIPPHTKLWVTPFTALFHGVPSARTARLLIAMALPGQLVFLFASDYVSQGHTTVTAVFAVVYLTVTLVQVMLLLYTAHIIIHFMWKRKIDPDNSAIPYLTALGDLSGSSLLLVAFIFLQSIGYGYGESNN